MDGLTRAMCRNHLAVGVTHTLRAEDAPMQARFAFPLPEANPTVSTTVRAIGAIRIGQLLQEWALHRLLWHDLAIANLMSTIVSNSTMNSPPRSFSQVWRIADGNHHRTAN